MKVSKVLLSGLFAAVLAASQFAKADGFVCLDKAGTYAIKLYDNVQPNLGTRVPAVMILSDSTQDLGSRTLATFSQAQGNLSYVQGSYHAVANFPAAYSQFLGSVKMSQISELIFSIHHNFNIPLEANQTVLAQLRIQDKSHNTAYIDFNCSRYLKN